MRLNLLKWVWVLLCLCSTLSAAPLDLGASFFGRTASLYMWAPTADHYVDAPILSPHRDVFMDEANSTTERGPLSGLLLNLEEPHDACSFVKPYASFNCGL